MQRFHWVLISGLAGLLVITATAYAALQAAAGQRIALPAYTQPEAVPVSVEAAPIELAHVDGSTVDAVTVPRAIAQQTDTEQIDAEQDSDEQPDGEQADTPSSRGAASAPGTLRALVADGTLSIQETLTVMAGVELNLGDETYILSVPATLSIDSAAALAGAGFAADNQRRIGSLAWQIEDIEEHDAEYAVSQFTTLTTSSPENKLVVIHSQATNLGREPFNFTRGLREEFAYDELGNLYESTRRSCEDINPGASKTCTLIFDVPAHVNIVGLDLGVVDYRRLPLAQPEE